MISGLLNFAQIEHLEWSHTSNESRLDTQFTEVSSIKSLIIFARAESSLISF